VRSEICIFLRCGRVDSRNSAMKDVERTWQEGREASQQKERDRRLLHLSVIQLEVEVQDSLARSFGGISYTCLSHPYCFMAHTAVALNPTVDS
jgi:hypothetical protein